MNENVSNENAMPPMLFPFDPEEFWQQVRLVIREELQVKGKNDLYWVLWTQTKMINTKQNQLVGNLKLLEDESKPRLINPSNEGQDYYFPEVGI